MRSMRIMTKTYTVILVLAINLLVSSFCFCNGFITSSSSAAVVAFRSTTTQFSTSTKTTSKNLPSSFVRVPQFAQSSFRTRTAMAATASASALSSSLSLSSSNEDNGVPDKDSAAIRSNWRAIGNDNTILRQGKNFVSDVYFGLAHVHRNCIRIYWKILIKRKILLVYLFADIPFYIFLEFEPTTGIAISAQKYLLVMLTQITSLTSTINQIFFIPIIVPLQLLLIGPKLSIKILMNPKVFIKMLPNMIMRKSTGNGNDSMSGMPQSVMLMVGIIIAPIIEEVIYRFGFDKIWHSVLKIIRSFIPGKSKKKEIEVDDANNQNHRLSKTGRWFGYRPWILVSSIYFGLRHLSNHLPLNPETVRSSATAAMAFEAMNESVGKKGLDYYTADISSMLLLSAIFQWVFTTNIALEILGPIYCKRGIGASIGAHIMLNLNALLFFPSIFWGLLIRLFYDEIPIFQMILFITLGIKNLFMDRFRKKKKRKYL